jgi:hypothetical protein
MAEFSVAEILKPLPQGAVALREYVKFSAAVSETVVVANGAARTLSRLNRDLLRV